MFAPVQTFADMEPTLLPIYSHFALPQRGGIYVFTNSRETDHDSHYRPPNAIMHRYLY